MTGLEDTRTLLDYAVTKGQFQAPAYVFFVAAYADSSGVGAAVLTLFGGETTAA